MTKKGIPFSLQLLLFIGFIALFMTGGYFLTRKTMLYAEVSATPAGVSITNQNNLDWKPALVFLNHPRHGIEAKLPTLVSGETYFIPVESFHSFFKNREIDSLEVTKIWISDMEGFGDRSFDIDKWVISRPITAE